MLAHRTSSLPGKCSSSSSGSKSSSKPCKTPPAMSVSSTEPSCYLNRISIPYLCHFDLPCFPIRPGDKSPPVQAIFILSQVSNSSLTHIRNMWSSEKNESQTLLKDCGFFDSLFSVLPANLSSLGPRDTGVGGLWLLSSCSILGFLLFGVLLAWQASLPPPNLVTSLSCPG